MRLRTLFLLMFLLALGSCAWNKPAQEQEASILPSRAESVGFFSSLYRSIRDTERATYGLMYDMRDGYDSFIYDVQKDYYEDYQK
jgi:hypothetical protein